MTINKELQKEYAVKAMRTLGILPAYVNAFKAKRQRVCEFANFGGFYIDEDSDLYAKIKEVEQETGCIVYAVTHSVCDDMEMYEMLLVSAYEEDMARSVEYYGNNTFIALAWVYNVTCPHFSEMGTIGVRSFGGGIRRAW